MQLKDFRGATLVNSLPQVEQEGLTFGGLLLFGANVRIHRQGMRPSVFAKNADDKIVFKYGGLVGIVVAYGGHAAEQVANPTPPQANFARDLAMLAHG